MSFTVLFGAAVSSGPVGAQQDRPLTNEEIEGKLQSLPNEEGNAWFDSLPKEQRDAFTAEMKRRMDRLQKDIDYEQAALELVNAGYEAGNAGDHETAVRLLTQALETHYDITSGLPGVYLFRGRSNRHIGNHEQAIADLTEALRLAPSLGAAVYGNRAPPALAALGRLDEALAEYGRAINAEPDFPGNYVDRGNLWIRLGDPEKAITDFDRAIAVDPGSALAVWTKGHWLEEQGDYGQVEALFSRAIELNGADVAAYYWRALALGRKENLEAAIADLDHIIVVTTRNPEVPAHGLIRPRLAATNLRATIKKFLKDYVGAQADLDWIIEQEETPYSYFERGEVHFQLRQDRAAVADFGRVIELEPDNKGAYRQHAFVYTQNRVYDLALPDLDRLIAFGGDAAERATWVYAARGLAHAELNNPGQGLADADQAIALYPDYGWAHAVRGIALRYFSRFDEARAAYEEALRLNPNEVEAHFRMGFILSAKQATLSQAMPHLEKAVALDPTHEQVRNTLAWIHATASDPAFRDGVKAVAHATTVIKINPHPLYRDTLSAAYAEAGQFDKAVAESERAVSEAKDQGLNDLLSELKARLALFAQGKPYRQPADE